MSAELSPSTRRPFGLSRTTRLLCRTRSTIYAARSRRSAPAGIALRRGPKTAHTDADLTERIRAVLEGSPFVGEGHRKAWARLRAKGIRTSKARVLRLMREANLLAPSRGKRVLGPKVHDGTIITDAPDQMWGIDATTSWTEEDGVVTIFAAVDHFNSECKGIHLAKPATRFEALEPIRQGVRKSFAAYRKGISRGLKLRHDHGSQFMSDAFQDEIEFLGIESSPAFVRAPEGNGCVERFFRTLKEQLLWLKVYRNAEELRRAIVDWARVYNAQWLLERHGYRSPNQVARDFVAKRASA